MTTTITPFILEKTVDEWTEADVADFFVKNKTQYHLKDEHIQAVIDQEYDGTIIFTLTQEHLFRFGLKTGPSLKILRLISQLRDSMGPSEPSKWDKLDFVF